MVRPFFQRLDRIKTLERGEVGPPKGLIPQGRSLKEILQSMQDQRKTLLGDTPKCIQSGVADALLREVDQRKIDIAWRSAR